MTMCPCVIRWLVCRLDTSPGGEGFSGSCTTGKGLGLMLIKSSVFEHVSTSEHQRWLRLCMIAIVICLLATCPYLHNHVQAHTKAPVPCWYSHKQPCLTDRLLFSSSVCVSSGWQLLKNAPLSLVLWECLPAGPDSSVPSRKKSRHASLIIHRLSAPLPRSLLWVLCKGRNQLPWIQLPQ